ncbi:MAG TPA: replicative DNA helicase [Nitrososphaera sp.]
MSHQQPNIPPQATDIEQAVLGACMIEQEALLVMLEQLNADDFYKPGHQSIYRAMRTLFEQGKDIDLFLIESYLDDRGDLELVGGTGYLSDLIRHVGSTANTDYHCQIIKEKSKRRQLIEACERITNQAYDQSEDTYDVLDFADGQIFGILNEQHQNNVYEPRQTIEAALEHLINIQGAPDGVTGIPSGLDLDGITAGWQKGGFYVIAGRPSMGKTAFVLSALKHAAGHTGNAALLSLEMSYRSLGFRMIVSEAGVNGDRARKGQLSEPEMNQVHEAAEHLLDMGVIVDDTTVVTPHALRTKAKMLKHKYDIQLLAIDYLQLLTSDKDVREQQVAEISRTSKAIAKELDIPVLGLSQLNRGCESRPGLNKRPMLADLRESGAIEQDADAVIFLFRPEYYGIKEYPEGEGERWSGQSTNGICELLISKQRNGPTGMVRQLYDADTMNFKNYTPEPWYRQMGKNNKPF